MQTINHLEEIQDQAQVLENLAEFEAYIQEKHHGLTLSSDQKSIIIFPWVLPTSTQDGRLDKLDLSSAKQVSPKHLLIKAGAGSGKTFILLQRVLFRLLYLPSYSLKNLLLISYTNASAAKLREELENLLENAYQSKILSPRKARIEQALKDISLVSIKTIHSFCLDLIRKNLPSLSEITEIYSKENTLTDKFTLLNEEERKLILEDCIKQIFAEEFNQDPQENQEFYALIDSIEDKDLRLKLKHSLLDILATAKAHPYYREKLAYLAQNSSQQLNFNKQLILEFLDFFQKIIKSDTEPMRKIRSFVADEKQSTNKKTAAQLKRLGNLEIWVSTFFTVKELFEKYDKKTLSKLSKEELVSFWTEIAENSVEKEIYSDRHTAYLDPIKDEIRTIKDSGLFLFLTNIAQIDDKMVKDLQKKCKLETALLLGELFPQNPYFSLNINQYLSTAKGDRQNNTAFLNLLLKLDSVYQAEKLKKNVVDFVDLEHYALHLLKNPEISNYNREVYQEIYLDEYQDISPIQEGIVQQIASSSLFMVGDIKQSIYRFREACPEIFLSKEKIFIPISGSDVGTQNLSEPSTKEAKGYLLELKENYRSHPTILKTVNSLMQTLMIEDFSELDFSLGHQFAWPKSKQRSEANEIGQQNPNVHWLLFEPKEVNLEDSSYKEKYIQEKKENKPLNSDFYLLASIRELLKQGVLPEEIAILAPKNKYLLEYQNLLEQAGLYSKTPTTSEIKDSFSYLQCKALLDFCLNIRKDEALLSIIKGGFWCAPFTNEELMLIRYCSPLFLEKFEQKQNSKQDINLLELGKTISFADSFFAYQTRMSKIYGSDFMLDFKETSVAHQPAFGQQGKILEFFTPAEQSYLQNLIQNVYKGQREYFFGFLAEVLKKLFTNLQWLEKCIKDFSEKPLGQVLLQTLEARLCHEAILTLYQKEENQIMALDQLDNLKSFLKSLANKKLLFYEEQEEFYRLSQLDNLGGGEEQLLDKEGIGVKKQGKISFFTFHKSKGLEFQYVFLVGLDDDFSKDFKRIYLTANRSQTTHFLQADVDFTNPFNEEGFNIISNNYNWIEKDGKLLIFQKYDEKLANLFLPQIYTMLERKKLMAEKVRLLYVALTRARHGLFLLTEPTWLYDIYTLSKGKISEKNKNAHDFLAKINYAQELGYAELNNANSYLQLLLLAFKVNLPSSFTRLNEDLPLGTEKNATIIRIQQILSLSEQSAIEELACQNLQNFSGLENLQRINPQSAREKDTRPSSSNHTTTKVNLSWQENMVESFRADKEEWEKALTTLKTLKAKLMNEESGNFLSKTSVSKIKSELNKSTSIAFSAPDKSTITPLAISKEDLQKNVVEIIKDKATKTTLSSLTGAEKGTIVHRFWFYFSFQDLEEPYQHHIKQSIEQLKNNQLITELDYTYLLTQVEKIELLLRSELGQKLIKAAKNNQLYREMPFSLFLKNPNLSTETGDKNSLKKQELYVQGIIDAFSVHEDEVILLDYKTDYVAPFSDVSKELSQKYAVQLKIYGLALSRALKIPLKKAFLWHLATATLVEISLENPTAFLADIFQELSKEKYNFKDIFDNY